MVEYLTMAVPPVIDRSGIEDKEALKHFEIVTGIKKTRRYDGDTTDMILAALKACDFSAEGITGVIVVTQSPDRLSPCLAVEVHNYLKLPKWAPAFDINHACDGWVIGLHMAKIVSEKTLLICADRLRYAKTPIEGLIFSDSVSITVVNANYDDKTMFYTDGSESSRLYCGLDGEMDMDGSFVFDFATTEIPKLIKIYNEKYPCDVLVPHQANLAMNKILAARSGFSKNWLSSIEEYGNQSMNSVPMAITANEERALGKNLLLCGFGAGMTAALMKVKWPEAPVTFTVQI